MKPIVKRNLGIILDINRVKKQLRVTEDFDEDFLDVYNECVEIADPKYSFTECSAHQDDTYTYIENECFESRVMRVNLQGISRVFPCVTTCGRELYDLAQGKSDPLEKFWVDSISEQYLHHAGALAREDMKSMSGIEDLYCMSPGSLADFPITCQAALFRLIEGVSENTGVRLTDSSLMLPYKSGSGIYFKSEHHFINCSLCPREKCPNRRAPFNEMDFNQRYALGEIEKK